MKAERLNFIKDFELGLANAAVCFESVGKFKGETGRQFGSVRPLKFENEEEDEDE